MRCDYAPMEGITNYLCRNAHHRYLESPVSHK